MNEETKKILDMISNGTITQEEGGQLLEAIYANDKQTKQVHKNSTLRVRVLVNKPDGTEKATVNVNIPLVLAKKVGGLMSLIPNDAKNELREKGVDLDTIDLVELIEMFENGEITEDLVNVDATDKKETAKVRVYVD